MAYIDEAGKQAERLVKIIAADPTIPKSTKKCMEGYMDFMRARGLSDRTISKNMYCMAVFLKTVGTKDLKALTKDDLMHSMAAIEKTKYSVKTKQNIKISVKAFYKHLLGDDEIYPQQVRWIKTSIAEHKRILPQDILSEEDVMAMLNETTDPRDRAIIAVLFDSGIRVGEMLSMKLKNVDLHSEPVHIQVTGKTGSRQLPIMFSVPYLTAYLNLHKDKLPDDPLWIMRGTLSNHNRAIDRSGIAKVLQIAAYRAKITKRVNPHSFRHARATYYANRLTEQQLKMFFGWTSDSHQASTYVHLSGRDIDNGVMQANGMKVPELQEPKLKIVPCPKCRDPNSATAIYCSKCGGYMDVATAYKIEEMRKAAAEASGGYGGNEEVRRGTRNYIVRKRRERKK